MEAVHRKMQDLFAAKALGNVVSEITSVSGGFMHRMYRVKTADSIYAVKHLNREILKRPIDNGLGGMLLEEVPVEPHVKDLSVYERACDYENFFDITNWRFYMAFDGETPVGAATVVGTTPDMNMLGGRTDACVLWDIRVSDAYKHQGIGQALFDMARAGAKEDGYAQMVIECQNNNVTACNFYKKQGAKLGKIDMSRAGRAPDVSSLR